MAKAGPKPGTGTRAEPTRARIVQAAIEALKNEGFAGASTRAIARTGRFNQALIFYHFGTLNDLLLAALDETSDSRMRAYTKAVEGVKTLPDLFQVAAGIYREDLESGHIKVMAEMIAAASSTPELGPAITTRIEPWVRFTQEAVDRVVEGSPLQQFVPAKSLAFAIVSLYLGMELLTHLDGDRSQAEGLFETGARFSSLLQGLLGGAQP